MSHLTDTIAEGKKKKRRAAERRRKEIERTQNPKLKSDKPPKTIKRGPNFFGEKSKPATIESKPGSPRTVIRGDTARKRIEDALK